MNIDGPFAPDGIALAARFEKGEVVEARPATTPDPDTLVLPGLVSGHLQCALAFLPGMPRADERKLLDAFDEEALLAAARLAALECALSGITTVCELWRGKMIDGVLDVLGRAYADVGIRLIGAVEADDARDAKAAMRENVRFARAGGHALMGLGVVQNLMELVTETRRNEMSMHVILRADFQAMAERAALRPDSIAVIEKELSEDEQTLLRDLAIWTVGDIAKMPLLRGRTLLGGTDVLAAAARSADPLSLFARGWDAAAAICDAPFGRLALGAPADFVLCDAPLPASPAPATMPAHFRALTARHVRDVVCKGESIVRDRRATRVDAQAIRASAREHLAKVWRRAA